VSGGPPSEGPASPGPTGSRAGWFCGVDVGAASTKLVLLGPGGEVAARVVRPSGVDYAATAAGCLEEALAMAGRYGSDVTRTVSTGYGRGNVGFADAHLTEIHCHGLGCYHTARRAITIIDVGGQDNKIIRLAEDGRRLDFKMNRKCAAGTGAFLEEIALRLDLRLEDMDPLARQTTAAVRLSSYCTVFAKTEILAHLRAGVPVAEIVRGAFHSVVARVMEMAPLDGEVVLTGGVVAHNPTVAEILSAKLGRPVRVPPQPQFTGALGAALSARRQAMPEEPPAG
jgi:predicted CoA-substrate-specific enzyme activase